MTLGEIVAKLSKSKYFWLLLSALLFVGLAASKHLFTALTLLFVSAFIFVGLKAVNSFLYPEIEGQTQAILVLISVALLVFAIGCAIFSKREWSTDITQIPTPQSQPSPTIKQTPTVLPANTPKVK